MGSTAATTRRGYAAVGSRVRAVDAARGVALLAMFAVHLLPGTDPDGSTSTYELLTRGRASAAFAVLAGVALALSAHRVGSIGLLVRCALIGLLGLWLGGLDSGLAVILPYYALLFACAVPLRRLGARALAAVAVAFALLGPALSHVLRDGMVPRRGPSAVLADLGEPGTLLRELVFTGYYPVLGWVAYLAAGMAVGRLDLRSVRVARWLLAGGVGLAIVAVALSRVLLSTTAAREAVPGAEQARFSGTTPTDSWWWLAGVARHSTTPLDLAHTTGTALALLGALLLLERHLPRVVEPIAWVGSMTLTLYTLHVVAVAEEVGPVDPEQLWLVHAAAAFVLAAGWLSLARRGPLEQAVAWASRAGDRSTSR